jgi:hypothetical protein
MKNPHITQSLPWKPKWGNQHYFGFGYALYYLAMGKLQSLWFNYMLLNDIWESSLHHSHPKNPFLIVGKHDIED